MLGWGIKRKGVKRLTQLFIYCQLVYTPSFLQGTAPLYVLTDRYYRVLQGSGALLFVTTRLQK